MISRRVRGWAALAVGVMLLLVGAALLYWGASKAPRRQVLQVPCADVVAGCALPAQPLRVVFDKIPQPMKPFRLRVEVPDAHEVHASFAMRDMQMGLNRYRLLPDGIGAWQGEVTLPVCVHGRSDWEMTLDVDGRLYLLVFASG